MEESLKICGKSMRSAVFRNDCFQAARDAEKGATLPEIVLAFPYLFPIWVAPLVYSAMGDHRRISTVLRRAATTLAEQKHVYIALFQSIVIPFLFLLLIQLILIVVLAFALPLIRMIALLSF